MIPTTILDQATAIVADDGGCGPSHGCDPKSCQCRVVASRILALASGYGDMQPMESAPKDGTWIVAVWQTPSGKRMLIAVRHIGNGMWQSALWDAWRASDGVLGWWPLPPLASLLAGKPGSAADRIMKDKPHG